MKRLATLGAVLILLGCGGKREDHYREIVDRANPIIVKLQPAALLILDQDKRSDVEGVTTACLDSLEVAKQLGAVRFDDRMQHEGDKLGVDDIAPLLSSGPGAYCNDAHRKVRDETCRDWCVDRFRDLADAIDRARDQAAKENVRLESLRK